MKSNAATGNLCPTHKERLSNYCTKCREFVCIKCIGVGHFGHGILYDYMMAMLNNSNEKIEVITKHIDQVNALKKEFEESLNSYVKDLEQMKSNLLQSMEFIGEIINKSNVDDSIKSFMRSLKSEENEEKNDFKQFLTLQNELKMSVQNKINQIMTKYHSNKLIDKSIYSVSYIHSFTNNTLMLALYDPTTKKHKTITMPTTVPDQAESISCDNRIFITGGYVSSVYQNTTKEYDEIKFDLISKANMTCTRTRHSLASILGGHLIVCGGYNGAQTNTCEKYSIDTNTWTPLPHLNQARDTAGLCFFKSIALYIFCGYYTSNRIKSCEKLDVYPTIAPAWLNVTIDESVSGWAIRDALRCFELSPDSIIIFGGNDGQINNKCFIAKIASDSSIKMEATPYALAIAGEFVFTASVVSEGDKIYAVDNNRHMHIFDMIEKKWEVIYKASWYC